MSLQQRDARASEDIINARATIRTCRCEFVTRAVEARVKYFVIVTSEYFNALTCADIPKSASPIYATRQAVVTREVELAA